MVSNVMKSLVNDAMDEAFNMTELFNMFDKDGSGNIDFNEFIDLCKYLGINLGEENMLQLFARSDKDHDGMVNYDEFAQAMIYLRYFVAKQSLEKIGLSA